MIKKYKKRLIITINKKTYDELEKYCLDYKTTKSILLENLLSKILFDFNKEGVSVVWGIDFQPPIKPQEKGKEVYIPLGTNEK